MRGDRARSALAGSRFADVRWVAETGSTNRDLSALATAGAAEMVLVADHQIAGRGRLDRTWDAPVGASLLTSVLVRMYLDPEDAFLLTAAMAVAATNACKECTGVEPGIKWPNDLVVSDSSQQGERKLGGILSEAVTGEAGLEGIVIGLGLNVDWPTELPAHLADTAVALNHLVGSAVPREELLVAILLGLERQLAGLASPAGIAAVLVAYRERSATIGRTVRVHLPSETFEGRAEDLTARGHLLVRDASDGRIREVIAGDVVHLRHR